MITLAICIAFFLGFIAGWLFRGSYTPLRIKEGEGTPEVVNYKSKNTAKVLYENDVERIRELNHLSANESKFMRILQHQFTNQNLVVKDKRFYITDKDSYPVAVFEYHEGQQKLRMIGNEDGVRVFFYKAILSSEAIAEDRKIVLWSMRNG